MMKRILVGLGGTTFTPTAIRYAVELGQIHQADLLGVTVLDRRRLGALTKASGTGKEAIRELTRLEELEERQEQSIAELESACAAASLRCDVTRESGDAFEKMISQARYYDLMIFGLRSLFEPNVIPGSGSDVLTRLVSRGVRPILAVSESYRPIRRVLLAYSGSMESAKSIKKFMSMHLWPDLTFKVVTFDRAPEDANELLEDAADYCRAYGYEAEVECVEGAARQQLLPHAAAWKADLILLGNSAKNVWVKKLLGETALHVIRHADIPLFLSQ